MSSSPDPGEVTRLTSPFGAALRDLHLRLDAQIAEVYAAHGVSGVRPRFSMVMIYLDGAGPMTIRDLAKLCEVSHSAMSQTVRSMKSAGLLHSKQGTDARTQLIVLSDEGSRIVPFLRAEWSATEAALAEIEAEIPYPLQKAITDLHDRLDERSFQDRITAHLDPDAVAALKQ